MGLFASIIPGWRYVSAGVGILVLLLAGWWVLKTWVFMPSDLPETESKALSAACDNLITQMRLHMEASGRGHMTLALPAVRHDTSNGQVRKTLEKRLRDGPGFTVVGKDFLDDIGGRLTGWLTGGDDPSPQSVLEERGELDGVLLVTMGERRTTRDEAMAGLTAALYERSGAGDSPRVEKILFSAADKVPLDEELEAAGMRGFWGNLWWSLWRIMASVLGAAAIPFLFLPFTDPITRRGSNVLGFIYLGGVTLIAMVPWLALLIIDPEGGTTSAWIFGGALLMFASMWTYRMHDAWTERL